MGSAGYVYAYAGPVVATLVWIGAPPRAKVTGLAQIFKLAQYLY
jgi:hypothetical protein